MLEKLFYLVVVSRDPQNIEHWIRKQLKNYSSISNNVKKGRIPGVTDNRAKEYEIGNAEDIQIRKLAEKAELEWDYYVVYRGFSSYVHPNESGILDDVNVVNGSVGSVNIAPSYKKANDLLLLASRYIILALQSMAKIVKPELWETVPAEYKEYISNAKASIEKEYAKTGVPK